MGTLVTQSRSASLVASLSVRVPDSTGTTVAPSSSHPVDVERLARHVLGAHVHHALESEAGADRRRGDAMLPCPGLGDDPPLAHPQGEQRLSDRVVDLVRAGVIQVFALEQQPWRRPPAEAGRLGERCRAPHELGEQALELGPERGLGPGRVIERRQIVERRDERLGHVAAAVGPEPSIDGTLRR